MTAELLLPYHGFHWLADCEKNMRKSTPIFFWRHFDARRTKDGHGDANILIGNLVNLSVLADSTHWDHIYKIASSASRPFQVKYVCDKLKEHAFPRGQIYFGHAGDQIQQIMMNYPTLRWWMERYGLVIDEPAAELGPIEQFDRIGGDLLLKHMKADRLSGKDLLAIARELDAHGFELKEHLQKAQWGPIAEHNQRFARSPIRTFAAAASNPKFSRSIRRRLYIARDRFKKAQRLVTPILIEY